MFGTQVEKEIQRHARSVYPEESVGFVINGEYVPQKNISNKPLSSFLVDPRDYPEQGLQAVVHSHPEGELIPSEADMRCQITSGVPAGIVCSYYEFYKQSNILWFGNGVEPPPLLERPFRWGPSGSDGKGDCYALIKDYYLIEKEITIPDYPRAQDFWKQGQSLYMDNFRSAGFEEVQGEPQQGDVVIMSIRSQVPNHAGIYLGNGLLLHHLMGRLSRREPLNMWRKKVNTYLRYVG